MLSKWPSLALSGLRIHVAGKDGVCQGRVLGGAGSCRDLSHCKRFDLIGNMPCYQRQCRRRSFVEQKSLDATNRTRK
jgi:hypothetical protein